MLELILHSMFLIGSLLAISWLVTTVCKWVIYLRLGLVGWHAFVPFFGAWKLYTRVCDEVLAMLYILLNCLLMAVRFMGFKLLTVFILSCVISVPIFALSSYCTYKVAEEFGKSGKFAVGMILLPAVFYPILIFTT